LKTTTSSSELRPRVPPATTSCRLVHLEPVENAGLDRLDQVSRLELRVLDRVAADEHRAGEHVVVELAAPSVVRADRAHERAVAQPVAAQHGAR